MCINVPTLVVVVKLISFLDKFISKQNTKYFAEYLIDFLQIIKFIIYNKFRILYKIFTKNKDNVTIKSALLRTKPSSLILVVDQ